MTMTIVAGIAGLLAGLVLARILPLDNTERERRKRRRIRNRGLTAATRRHWSQA